MLSTASDKAKLFTGIFSKNSNLDDSCISSRTTFSYRTNLKLYNIHVSPKTVKNVATDLDLPNAPGIVCIPVVVLKKCEHESSCISDDLFNMWNKGTLFFRWLEGLRRVHVLNNIEESCVA